MQIATLIVGEALLLGLIFYGFLRWCPTFRKTQSSKDKRSRDGLRPESVAEPPAPEVSARRLIEEEPELAALYERLGFSLEFEREGQAILAELKGTLEVDIPDVPAFREAVASARERMRAASLADVGQDPISRALAERSGDSLLLAVEAAGEDEARLLKILGLDPVDQLLPVVEQMPFSRDGRVVWRTPMSLDLLHKKAADRRRFLGLLQRLESWVRGAKVRRGEEARAAVLDASDRLRRAVKKGETYLVTLVKALEECYADWYLQRRDPSLMGKRRSLDRLLLGLAAERNDVGMESTDSAEEAQAARERAADLAAQYCEQPWMKSPRLAALLLAHLLVTEARRFPVSETGMRPEPPSDPRTLLRAVRDEVVVGSFDVDETVRRLRDLEADGCAVHSLAFKLLRHIAAGAASARSTFALIA